MRIRATARTKKLLVIVGSIVVALAAVVTVTKASAGDLFSGYIWSSNIGFIKVNNCDTPTSCSGPGYGLTMDSSGNLSGYAWSSNIGWISFNSDATANCPFANKQCQAHVDVKTGVVTGAARACSVFASGCSGALAAKASLGNWDGWISLGDDNKNDATSFGVTIDMTSGAASGYAWGSDVIGWLDFSGVKLNTDSCAPGTPCYCQNNPTDITNCPDNCSLPDNASNPQCTSCAPGTPCYCQNNPTDTTNCPDNCPVGSTCWCAMPANQNDSRCAGGGGGGAECSNIPADILSSLEKANKVPPRKVPDANGDGGTTCLCNPGYVLNSQYICVQPKYTEQ
ncbi:MAG TPA: hypothetical protein VG621_00920 [Candidatus Paceibacterota bacterium]|nr:hypothetical protein [Candidatus Paceibacterota bacterium]